MGCIFPKDEVEYLYYPNAISMIVEVSSNSDEKQRQIIKSNFFYRIREKEDFYIYEMGLSRYKQKKFFKIKAKRTKRHNEYK